MPSDGNFEAAALVKQFFYEYCGPWTDFLGPFNRTLYTSRVAACRLWPLLQDLQGYLWVNATTGKTHPPGYFNQSDTDSTSTAMFSLFGTGQTWMSFGYDSYVAANKARRQMLSPTRLGSNPLRRARSPSCSETIKSSQLRCQARPCTRRAARARAADRLAPSPPRRPQVADGTWPAATTRSYTLSSGTLTNTNFVAIPINAPHLAAALVAANTIASREQMLNRANPSMWGSLQARGRRGWWTAGGGMACVGGRGYARGRLAGCWAERAGGGRRRRTRRRWWGARGITCLARSRP